MATIKDVARLSGSSISTVSRVLNKSGYVSEETEKRIREAIEKLQYHPNRNARSLVKQKTQTIGLVLPDIRNPFFPELARGIEDITQQNNYSVIYGNSDNDILKVNKYFKILKEKMVDGIIIAGEITNYQLQELSEIEIPLIVVDANVKGLPVNSVYIDNKYGGNLATTHLIEQGYNRIAHMRGPIGISTAEDRYTGYLEALEKHGLPYDPTLVQIGDYHIKSGYEAAQRLLALSDPPDAVFIANDLMALGAFTAISEANLKVPDEIGIVGYDGIPLVELVHPKLTTIKQPTYEIGVTTAKRLLNIINRPGAKDEIEVEVLKPILKIGNTTKR